MRQILTRKLSVRRLSRMEGEAQRRAAYSVTSSAIARIGGESKTQAPSRFSYCLSMISAQTHSVFVAKENQVPTFRDHAPSGGPHVHPVELCLLLVAQRAIELVQGGLRRLKRLRHCGQAVLHGGEPSGRSQRRSGLTLRLQYVCRLSGRIVERLQRVILGRAQMQRTLDPVDRQTTLRAVLSLAETVHRRTLRVRSLLLALVHRVESRTLLVAQRSIELLKGRPHRRDRLEHGVHARAHGRKPAGRRARQLGRAGGLKDPYRLDGCSPQVIQQCLLVPGRLDLIDDLLD